jgi:hypothetical protein
VLITDNSQRHLNHRANHIETIKLEIDFDVNNSNETKKKKIFIPPLKGLTNSYNEEIFNRTPPNKRGDNNKDNRDKNNAMTFRSNRESQSHKNNPNSQTDRGDIPTLRNNNSLREDMALNDYYSIMRMLKDGGTDSKRDKVSESHGSKS